MTDFVAPQSATSPDWKFCLFFCLSVQNPQVSVSLPCYPDFPYRLSNENGGYAPVRPRQHQAGGESIDIICYSSPTDRCYVFLSVFMWHPVFKWSLYRWYGRPWSMTSTLSWWKMPVWACVLRYTVPWNRAISSWMTRTKRAWRSLVSATASSLFLPSFFLLCVCLHHVPFFIIFQKLWISQE